MKNSLAVHNIKVVEHCVMSLGVGVSKKTLMLNCRVSILSDCSNLSRV
jgi:hypothetical protein